MKRYQKRILGILAAGLIFCTPVSVLAADTPLTITSGFDWEGNQTQSTFSESRTIYGEAKPNTQITVSVSRKDSAGEMQTASVEQVTVGAMGIFAATVGLDMGYNYVTLSAQKEGYDEVSHTMVVKRLPQQLKQELQSMIALPGLGG